MGMFGKDDGSGLMKQYTDQALDCARAALEDEALSALGDKAQRDAAKAQFAKVKAFSMPIAIGNMIPSGGEHPVHLDGHGRKAGETPSFHMIFHVGFTCTYHAGSTRDEKFDFTVRSGNVLIYDGMTAYHGLKNVRNDGRIPGGLPDWCQKGRMGVITEVMPSDWDGLDIDLDELDIDWDDQNALSHWGQALSDFFRWV